MSVSSSIFVRRPHIMPKRFTFKAPVKIISSVLISLIPWKIGYTGVILGPLSILIPLK
jgi:hypothetical protein